MPTINRIETADGLHWFHVNQHVGVYSVKSTLR